MADVAILVAHPIDTFRGRVRLKGRKIVRNFEAERFCLVLAGVLAGLSRILRL
jgi:hypothetical protein